MPLVEGNVFYSKDSYGGTIYDKFADTDYVVIEAGTGSSKTIVKPVVVREIPVVLAQIDTAMNIVSGLCIKTDANGRFRFNNVPSGNYFLIEAFGMPAAGVGEGDFKKNASKMSQVPAQDPPVSFIKGQGFDIKGATRIVSLSPNTFLIIVVAADVKNLFFLDAPVKDIPLAINNYVLIEKNLIHNADDGTFGSCRRGMPSNTSPREPGPYQDKSTTPYSGLSEFTYVQFAKVGSTILPGSGQYSIINMNDNINFKGVWYDMPNFTTGDETGRMMIVNGAVSASGNHLCIFKETIPELYQYSRYFFSVWICNCCRLTDMAKPNIRITVIDNLGNTLFDQRSINIMKTQDIPTWYQLGALIDTGAATGVSIKIYNIGTGAPGNAYAIDDILFQKLSIAPKISVKKTVGETEILEGEDIHYHIEIYNEGPIAAIDNLITDNIPSDTLVVSNEVKVIREGRTMILPGKTLNEGIYLEEIAVGETIRIEYALTVLKIGKAERIIRNESVLDYRYILNEEQGALAEQIVSNEVMTKVLVPKINFKKSSCQETAMPDSFIRYELLGINTGNVPLNWIEVVDELGTLSDYVSSSTQILIEKDSMAVTELQAEPEDVEEMAEGAYVIYTEGTEKHTYKVIIKKRILIGQLVRIKYMAHIKEEAGLVDKISNTAFISYGFDQGRERLSIWEEVQLPIAYARVSLEKGAYRKADGKEIPLPHRGMIECDEQIIYKLTLINSGNKKASHVEITDNIPEQIKPDYSGSVSCQGITKRVISPILGEETDVPCEDIIRLDEKIPNCITIRNLEVPARSGEDKYGILEIRIFGKVICT